MASDGQFLKGKDEMKVAGMQTDHVSAQSNDFTIKSRLNGRVPLRFLYWAFKLSAFNRTWFIGLRPDLLLIFTT